MQPNYRSLARTFGYRTVDALRDMRECRTERDLEYFATVAAQEARTAARYALKAWNAPHPNPFLKNWNGR